tara:strand:+ start:2117 stop:3115 length:999 start_codon:yes stop_codon:yes gene_type:complete
MTHLIAETAWHHEGDFDFMAKLVDKICISTNADIVKFHITLDLEEYMSKKHSSFKQLQSWMFTKKQWTKLIQKVKKSKKKIMLLLNDVKAIEFASKMSPDYVELHSVCLNVPRLMQPIKKLISKNTKIVIGEGGSTLSEIKNAVTFFGTSNLILMFGFQNYPTKYEYINLKKIKKIQSLFPNLSFGYADHCAWNEKNNELITLIIASHDIKFVEKHITNCYGSKRCDSASAISIEMFNSLSKKIKMLNKLNGDGRLALNKNEKKYSEIGPMKMAAVASVEMNKGDILLKKNIYQIRTNQKSDINQIELLKFINRRLKRKIKKGNVIRKIHFR